MPNPELADVGSQHERKGMEGESLLQSHCCCFLQHGGVRTIIRSPRYCPQHLHCSLLMEVVSDTLIVVPDAQMGTWEFHGTEMCLVAARVVHILLSETAFKMQIVLLLLEFAPDVQIVL